MRCGSLDYDFTLNDNVEELARVPVLEDCLTWFKLRKLHVLQQVLIRLRVIDHRLLFEKAIFFKVARQEFYIGCRSVFRLKFQDSFDFKARVFEDLFW